MINQLFMSNQETVITSVNQNSIFFSTVLIFYSNLNPHEQVQYVICYNNMDFRYVYISEHLKDLEIPPYFVQYRTIFLNEQHVLHTDWFNKLINLELGCKMSILQQSTTYDYISNDDKKKISMFTWLIGDFIGNHLKVVQYNCPIIIFKIIHLNIAIYLSESLTELLLIPQVKTTHLNQPDYCILTYLSFSLIVLFCSLLVN
ncbi:hypothetical protein KSF78_0002994 [Schistosoma japonicum]|nr:hypothetical protein KSF78_0002994 [Schistosoma japonicum]